MEGNKKESTASVEALLRFGMTRKEIFKELGGTDDLARIIALVPSFQTRQDHRGKNLTLVAVLVYLAVMKIVSGITMVTSTGGSPYLVLLAIPYAAIAMYLAVHVHRYHGWAYLMSSAVCLWVVGNSAQHIFTRTQGVLRVVNLLMLLPVLAGVVLGFVLKKKLCPDVGLLGAKTDNEGNYLFMSKAG